MKCALMLLSVFVFSNCRLVSAYRTIKATQKEKIEQQVFRSEIPFKEEKGFLIVKALINNKLENFIFDTGASTVLDDDFAKTIKYKKIGTQMHTDALNNKQNLKKIQLKDLSIGEINFKLVVANIFDLSKIKREVCLDIVGILGRNVLNKAVWQIDYKRHIITLTNSRDSLIQQSNKKVLNFYSVNNETPKIRLSADSVYLGEAELDTGSSGGINLPKDNMPKSTNSNSFINVVGITDGLFSEKIDKSAITVLPSLTMGNSVEIKNALVTFNENLPFALIGNRFLRDYIVTIDWKNQEITLAAFQPNSDYLHNSFGFSPKFKGGKIVVGSIIENSAAFSSGMRLNDPILQINQRDFRQANQSDFCTLIRNWFIQNEQQLSIVYFHENKEINVQLTKIDLINSVIIGH